MALKWNQVYILAEKDKEVSGQKARAHVKQTKPNLLRATSIEHSVVLEKDGKAVTENEPVKQMLREAYPDRVRFESEPSLKPATIKVRKGKDNVVDEPEPDYKEAQFIGFHVKPAVGQADLIAEGNTDTKSVRDGDYRGPRSKKAKPKDLKNRIAIMVDAIKAAAKSSKIETDDTVLKVFMAPEFFFRGYDGGYPIEKISSIMDDVRKETSKGAYKDWLFVLGTAIGFLPKEAGDRKYTFAVTAVGSHGTAGGKTLTVTKNGSAASADDPAVCKQVKNTTDANYQWTVEQGSLKAGVLRSFGRNASAGEYVLVLDSTAAFTTGTIVLKEPEATEIFNIALIQKGGPAPTGKAAGLRDAVVYKEYVSAIDFIGERYGQHSSFHLNTGTNRFVKIEGEVTRVLPTEGSVDVLSRTVNKPSAVTKITVKTDEGDQEVDHRVSEVSRVGYGGGSVFTIDDVTIGVEVCLDHAKAKLRGFYGGQATAGEPYVQIHLIPSWGMSIEPDNIGCPINGLVFNVDGSRGDSVARVNDYKFSCDKHPLVSEDTNIPCPQSHYVCVRAAHATHNEPTSQDCPDCAPKKLRPAYACRGRQTDHPLRTGATGAPCPECHAALAAAYYCEGTGSISHAFQWLSNAAACPACGDPVFEIGFCQGTFVPHDMQSSAQPGSCVMCDGPLKQWHYCVGHPLAHPISYNLGPGTCAACNTAFRTLFSCSGAADGYATGAAGKCKYCDSVLQEQKKPKTPALRAFGTGIPLVDGPTDFSLSGGLDWDNYYEGTGQIAVYAKRPIPPREVVT